MNASNPQNRDGPGEDTGHRDARALSLGIELHAAANSGDAARIAILIEHGANVEARLPDGRRPLHTAAQGGQPASVKALLEAGADPNAPNRHAMSWTPLHLAAVSGDAASIKALLGVGADTSHRDVLGRTPSDLLPASVPHGVREACRPYERAPAHENRERRTEMAEVNLRKDDWVRQPDGSWAQVVSVDGHGAWLEGNLVTAHRTDAENVRVAGQIGPDGERWQPPDRSSREPAPQQERRTAMNDVPEAAEPNKGAPRREEQARQRQRNDQLLQLTCMASERIPPDQRLSWGDLEKRLDDLISVVDRAEEADPEAIDAQARRTARKRAEADVWARAAREAGGSQLHQARARFAGSAEFCRQDQMARNAEALTKGLEGVTQEDLRPNNLERLVAKAVVVTKGTGDAEVARALETGLRYGWVPAATRIRHEREQMVDKLSRTVEPMEKRDRTELTERLYQLFPEDEIRSVCRGEGRTVEAVQDPDARSRLIGNFRNLHAEPVELPVPWRAAQSAISAIVNPAAVRQQAERSAAVERNMISASM